MRHQKGLWYWSQNTLLRLIEKNVNINLFCDIIKDEVEKASLRFKTSKVF